MVYCKYIFFNSVVKFNFLKVQVHVLNSFKIQNFLQILRIQRFFFFKLRVCVFSVILTNFLFRRSLTGWQVSSWWYRHIKKNLQTCNTLFLFSRMESRAFFNHLILCSIIHVHKQLKFIKMFYDCMLTRNTLK